MAQTSVAVAFWNVLVFNVSMATKFVCSAYWAESTVVL